MSNFALMLTSSEEVKPVKKVILVTIPSAEHDGVRPDLLSALKYGRPVCSELLQPREPLQVASRLAAFSSGPGPSGLVHRCSGISNLACNLVSCPSHMFPLLRNCTKYILTLTMAFIATVVCHTHQHADHLQGGSSLIPYLLTKKCNYCYMPVKLRVLVALT